MMSMYTNEKGLYRLVNMLIEELRNKTGVVGEKGVVERGW